MTKQRKREGERSTPAKENAGKKKRRENGKNQRRREKKSQQNALPVKEMVHGWQNNPRTIKKKQSIVEKPWLKRKKEKNAQKFRRKKVEKEDTVSPTTSYRTRERA